MKLKMNSLWGWMAALVLTAWSVALGPAALGAQSANSGANAQQQPAQSQQQQGQENTYVGEVVRAQNGQYALLVDKGAGRGYFLDDQAKASKYTAQTVKVTGAVNPQTKTLHIGEIAPVSK